MKIRDKLFWIVKAGIAGCFSLFLLSLVTLACNYSGVHTANFSGATDYMGEPYSLRTRMTEGFAWMRLDANGFNNSATICDESPDILLIGSSNMEAMGVAADENTGYLLNKLLPDLYTYNIGMGGHLIYHCVNNMKNAVSVYQPKKFVILETNSVELSVDDMKKVISVDWLHIPSYDSGFLYVIQKKIPSVKWLYKQLEDWKNKGDGAADVTEASRGEKECGPSEYAHTLDSFMKKATVSAERQGVRMIIFYHPIMNLNGDGKLFDNTNEAALETFRNACEKNNIFFVNMLEDFQLLYEQEHRLPYGFINTAVGKGHLNKYGHRIIAERLAKVIQSLEGEV